MIRTTEALDIVVATSCIHEVAFRKLKDSMSLELVCILLIYSPGIDLVINSGISSRVCKNYDDLDKLLAEKRVVDVVAH